MLVKERPSQRWSFQKGSTSNGLDSLKRDRGDSLDEGLVFPVDRVYIDLHSLSDTLQNRCRLGFCEAKAKLRVQNVTLVGLSLNRGPLPSFLALCGSARMRESQCHDVTDTGVKIYSPPPRPCNLTNILVLLCFHG